MAACDDNRGLTQAGHTIDHGIQGDKHADQSAAQAGSLPHHNAS